MCSKNAAYSSYPPGVASFGLSARLPSRWQVIPAYGIGTLAFAWVIERALATFGLR